jgi:short-subunit dehydrogenase
MVNLGNMKDNQYYALVTGGTSGIGYELAKLLARDGFNLVLVARHEDDLQRISDELKERYGVNVITMARDLFHPANAFSVYEETKSRNLNIQILVNDAGQGQFGEFTDTDIKRELDIINLNVASLVVLTKLFLRDMVSRGEGRILNLSSIASKMPGPWQSVYHGTKAFVQSFTESVHNEVKDSGVTVTALLPGVTDTDFFNKAEMKDSKILKETKPADPAEVAKDGYEALMKGDDKVISGLKNKVQVAMANAMPDAMVAENMNKKQQPDNQ